MPKVTLLGAPGKMYHYFYGREYKFLSGEPKDVPATVALELKKKLTRKGKPLFEVEDFDIPAKPAEPQEIKIPEQNALIPRQLRFGQWA